MSNYLLALAQHVPGQHVPGRSPNDRKQKQKNLLFALKVASWFTQKRQQIPAAAADWLESAAAAATTITTAAAAAATVAVAAAAWVWATLTHQSWGIMLDQLPIFLLVYFQIFFASEPLREQKPTVPNCGRTCS